MRVCCLLRGRRVCVHVSVRACASCACRWTTDDLSWLDGGCDRQYPRCTIDEATFALTNVSGRTA